MSKNSRKVQKSVLEGTYTQNPYKVREKCTFPEKCENHTFLVKIRVEDPFQAVRHETWPGGSKTLGTGVRQGFGRGFGRAGGWLAEGLRRVENRASAGVRQGRKQGFGRAGGGAGGGAAEARKRVSPAPARARVQKLPRFCRDEKSDIFRSRGESRETGRTAVFLEKKRFSPSPYILRKQRFKAVKLHPKKPKKTPARGSCARGKKVPDREKQPLFLSKPTLVGKAVSPQDSCFWLSSEKSEIHPHMTPKRGHPGR